MEESLEELSGRGYSAIPQLMRGVDGSGEFRGDWAHMEALSATGPDFMKQPEYAAALTEFRRRAGGGGRESAIFPRSDLRKRVRRSAGLCRSGEVLSPCGGTGDVSRNTISA